MQDDDAVLKREIMYTLRKQVNRIRPGDYAACLRAAAARIGCAGSRTRRHYEACAAAVGQSNVRVAWPLSKAGTARQPVVTASRAIESGSVVAVAWGAPGRRTACPSVGLGSAAVHLPHPAGDDWRAGLPPAASGLMVAQEHTKGSGNAEPALRNGVWALVARRRINEGEVITAPIRSTEVDGRAILARAKKLGLNVELVPGGRDRGESHALPRFPDPHGGVGVAVDGRGLDVARRLNDHLRRGDPAEEYIDWSAVHIRSKWLVVFKVQERRKHGRKRGRSDVEELATIVEELEPFASNYVFVRRPAVNAVFVGDQVHVLGVGVATVVEVGQKIVIRSDKKQLALSDCSCFRGVEQYLILPSNTSNMVSMFAANAMLTEYSLPGHVRATVELYWDGTLRTMLNVEDLARAFAAKATAWVCMLDYTINRRGEVAGAVRAQDLDAVRRKGRRLGFTRKGGVPCERLEGCGIELAPCVPFGKKGCYDHHVHPELIWQATENLAAVGQWTFVPLASVKEVGFCCDLQRRFRLGGQGAGAINAAIMQGEAAVIVEGQEGGWLDFDALAAAFICTGGAASSSANDTIARLGRGRALSALLPAMRQAAAVGAL